MTDTMATWMTVNESAIYLGVSERSLRRFATKGSLKSMKIGRNVYYDVTSYIAEKPEEATTEFTAPFIGCIYDSHNCPHNVDDVPITRPLVGFMLEGVPSMTSEGNLARVYRHVTFPYGTALDSVLPANGELFTSADINEILQQPAAVRMVESGELKFFVPTDPQFGASFRSFSRDDALVLIGRTYSLDLLNRYAEKEDRPVVLAAIDDKRAEIEKALWRNKNEVIRASDFSKNYRGVK